VRWLRAPWWTPAVRIAAAVGPLLTCAVLSPFHDDVTPAVEVLLLVVWVVAGAATADRLAALIAAVSSGIWFDFFLTAPYHQLTIDDSDDIVATILLVLIGVAVAELALWGHRQQAGAARHSGYLDGVLATATTVSEARTPTSTVITVVAEQIADVLDADDCRFVDGPVHDARIAVLDRSGDLVRDGRHVDVRRVGLPTDEYVAVPVRRGGSVLGHFLVTAATRASFPDPEQCRVAVLLADQVAGTLLHAPSPVPGEVAPPRRAEREPHAELPAEHPRHLGR
jgi:K+-sensing histidine kinase KdpD